MARCAPSVCWITLAYPSCILTSMLVALLRATAALDVFWPQDCGGCAEGYFGPACAGKCPAPSTHPNLPCGGRYVTLASRVFFQPACLEVYVRCTGANVMMALTGTAPASATMATLGSLVGCRVLWVPMEGPPCANRIIVCCVAFPVCRIPEQKADSGCSVCADMLCLPFRVCGGHGYCKEVSGTATCICGSTEPLPVPTPAPTLEPDPASTFVAESRGVGHWLSDDVCEACLPGWFGPSCSSRCPSANLAACTAHGSCNDGLAGAGTCECHDGWKGSDCSQPCPGPQGNLCTSHGVCQADGTCLCDGNAESGFWAGVDCAVCRWDYAGLNCTVQCPTDPEGLVCGGQSKGQCFGSGVCQCTPQWCGPTCFQTGADCLSECGIDQWGEECNPCPVGPNGKVCSGTGWCHSGIKGDGNCDCSDGWAGETCEKACPLLLEDETGQGLICGGVGRCDQLSGTCICPTGYYGDRCQVNHLNLTTIPT